jgi:hypothetical protein
MPSLGPLPIRVSSALFLTSCLEGVGTAVALIQQLQSRRNAALSPLRRGCRVRRPQRRRAEGGRCQVFTP